MLRFLLVVVFSWVALGLSGCTIADEDRCPEGQVYNSNTQLCLCPGGRTFNTHEGVCECAAGQLEDEAADVCCPTNVAVDADAGKCCPDEMLFDPDQGVCCSLDLAFDSEFNRCCQANEDYIAEYEVCCVVGWVWDPAAEKCVAELEAEDTDSGWDDAGFGASCATDADCEPYGLNYCAPVVNYCTYNGCQAGDCPSGWECCDCFGQIVCTDDSSVCSSCG